MRASARRFVVVGAGLSGATVARSLADAGHLVEIVDGRDHVAGNCFDERDASTGVLVHRYGPHIFHTQHDHVWDFVRRFGEFRPYRHRVKATTGGRVYSLPINLGTINQFFGKAMTPDEARAFLAGRAERADRAPTTFEEQALAIVGRELYEAFLRDYTRKQWGVEPARLPASVLLRLPVRFTYDDAYFGHRHQAMPVNGMTAIVTAMLDHPSIDVRLGCPAVGRSGDHGAHVIWTGALDAWFDHGLGRLGYRTLDFRIERGPSPVQGCAVMNHCDASVVETRSTEFAYLTPWEHHERSVVAHETSRAAAHDDVPYYPIRLTDDTALVHEYERRARAERGVTFLGRLGTYRYLDMDVCIHEALLTARALLTAIERGEPLPVLATDVVA